MAAGERLAQHIKNASKTGPSDLTDIIYGQVTSISPLKIKIENKFEVDEDFIILTRPVMEYKRDVFVDVPTHGTCKGYCIVFEDLKTGENVLMIKAQGDQKYVVLDRVEGE